MCEYISLTVYLCVNEFVFENGCLRVYFVCVCLRVSEFCVSVLVCGCVRECVLCLCVCVRMWLSVNMLVCGCICV